MEWDRDTSGEKQLPDPDPIATSQEYATHLERQLHFYTEAARRLGYDGSRVSRPRVVDAQVWGRLCPYFILTGLSANGPFL